MTTEQKLREAFEDWATNDGAWPNNATRSEVNPDGYANHDIQHAWIAVKACAAALSLPTQAEPVADGLIRQYIKGLLDNKPDDAAEATKRMVDYVFDANYPATPPASQEQAQQPKRSPQLGALLAVTAEKNKLKTALELACGYLTDEQVAEIAKLMPTEPQSQAEPAAREAVDLEWPLEQLVERCNNSSEMASCDEVIAAEAALERLYQSRKKQPASSQPAPANAGDHIPDATKMIGAELPDERAAFEAAAVELGWPQSSVGATWRADENDYSSGLLSNGWDFWKARAALSAQAVPHVMSIDLSQLGPMGADAERWRMAMLVQAERIIKPEARKNQHILNAYQKAIEDGFDVTHAIDAAIAARAAAKGE